MRPFVQFLFVILLAPSLHAQLHLLDDGLTPAGRYQNGISVRGSYDAQSPLHCSQLARLVNIPHVMNTSTILATLPNGTNVTVSGQIAQINTIINNVFNTLSYDPQLQKRSLCTGFYYEESSHVGNALSMGQGYLIFDYRLFQYLYALPDDKRSSWVYEFLVLHEFAHQLQYWNNDIEVAKTMSQLQNSRNPELAADCTAGALLALQNLNLNSEIYDISFKGVVGAAEALGDYDREASGHHGTPAERVAAATYGSKLIAGLKVSLTLGILKLSSQEILNSCNAYVRQMDDHNGL